MTTLSDVIVWVSSVGLIVTIVAVVAVDAGRKARLRRLADVEAARTNVEQRAIGLMKEHAHLSDMEVAQALSDSLINERNDNPLLWRWVTVETVSRLRRTAILIAGRRS